MKIEISANWELPVSYDGVVLPIRQVQIESATLEMVGQFWRSQMRMDVARQAYNLNLRAALRTIRVYVPGCKRLRIVER